MTHRDAGWKIVWSFGMLIMFFLCWPALLNMLCEDKFNVSFKARWLQSLARCAMYMFWFWIITLGAALWLQSR